MKITIEGWDPVDKQPVRGSLQGLDRAQAQAADIITVQLQHSSLPVTLKQNPTALRGSNIRVGACAWDGAYVLSAYLDSQPAEVFCSKRCVELGAGMGLVGLVLARLGAAVYLTDKPSMVVHGRVNAARNKLLATAAAAAPPPPAVLRAAAAAAAPQAVQQVTHNSTTSLQSQQDSASAAAAAAAPAVGTAAAVSTGSSSLPFGLVSVVPLDFEDVQSTAAAAAAITSQGPIDLIVATDCIYPDPNGTVPSSAAFMAAVAALAVPGHTRCLISFEARSDELRQALLSSAVAVQGSCRLQQLQQEQLPAAYRSKHIELYELLWD